jgi:hypothetical protein
MPKVHITLPHARSVTKHTEALNELLSRLAQEFGLKNVNLDRVTFLGIATGDMPEPEIERLRASGLVRAVAVDSVRSLPTIKEVTIPLHLGFEIEAEQDLPDNDPEGPTYMATLSFSGESVLLSPYSFASPELALKAAREALILLGRSAEALVLP